MNEPIDLEAFFCHECGKYLRCNHLQERNNGGEANPIFESLHKIFARLTSYGYIIFRGYPISTALSTSDILSCFFHQSIEEKMQYTSKDRARRGYCPVSSENFATLVGVSGKPNDTVEKFRIGPIIEEHMKQQYADYFQTKDGRIHFYPNNLELFSFEKQEVLRQYYASMESLSKLILNIIELSCSLPLDSLSQAIDRHTSILTFNFYPNLIDHAKEVERIADHTDVSMFTIVTELLSTASDEGTLNCELHLCNLLTNEWEVISLRDGEFAVNIGDCLKDWSKGLLKSARHRVVGRNMEDVPPRERLTSAFFFSPNYDALLAWPDGSLESTEVPYTIWRKNVISKAMSKLRK